MLRIRAKAAVTAASILLSALLYDAAQAKPEHEHALPDRPDVDLVIALDVSGSMSGLLDSAKQRLWDIVNELGRAQPQPRLRVAILSYGNPSYGADTGYVRLDRPFTTDLDAVNETLFAFRTNGGDEYVARAVHTSIRRLQWSTEPGALRIMFIAGNESAEQDPLIPIQRAAKLATENGIIVNTIYCGAEGDNVSEGWAKVANLTQGMYASIDQNAAAVANIATPMDAQLAALNQELNKTYVPYGRHGKRYRDNQLAQDENAAKMSAPALASRTVTKAGALYNGAEWDLVDALEAGRKLEEVEKKDLPAEMQSMEALEREQFVKEQSEKRQRLEAEIVKLDEERRSYIAEKRREAEASGPKGLDEVILEGLRRLAMDKGFTFDSL